MTQRHLGNYQQIHQYIESTQGTHLQGCHPEVLMQELGNTAARAWQCELLEAVRGRAWPRWPPDAATGSAGNLDAAAAAIHPHLPTHPLSVTASMANSLAIGD